MMFFIPIPILILILMTHVKTSSATPNTYIVVVVYDVITYNNEM